MPRFKLLMLAATIPSATSRKPAMLKMIRNIIFFKVFVPFTFSASQKVQHEYTMQGIKMQLNARQCLRMFFFVDKSDLAGVK